MHSISRRQTLALTTLGALGALAAPLRRAHAQAFPTRPVTLIVPYPAGGPTDRHARLLAELIKGPLGQPLIVDNKPGAAGTLGATVMAQTAKADGYTVSLFAPAMLRLPHMQAMHWHPINDFSFVVGLAVFGSGLLVRADSAFKTAADLLRAARSEPISYGSAGIGSAGHLMIEQLAQAAQVQLTHVPYKGSPDMMQALLGGHIHAACDVSGWEKLVEDGRLRLLMTFGERPNPLFAQVPTAKALGFGLVSDARYGVVAPKDMDSAAAKRLQELFTVALGDARNLALMAQQGLEPWPLPGHEFRTWATQEFERQRLLLQRLGLAAK